MGFKVGIGKSDFEALRKSDNYYVDKTAILYELIEETDNQVTLFTVYQTQTVWQDTYDEHDVKFFQHKERHRGYQEIKERIRYGSGLC